MPIRGVDVSRFQGYINWEEMPAWVEFAYIGVMDWRANTVDRMARTNAIDASRTRVTGGYYRVDAVRRTPRAECMTMLDVISNIGLLLPGNIIPAVDIEPTDDPVASSRVNWSEWANEFSAEWYATIDMPLMMYGSGSFLRDSIKISDAWDRRTRCWVGHTAKWATPKGQTPEQFAGNTNFTFNGRTAIHQFDIDNFVIDGQLGAKFDRNQLMEGVALHDIMIPLTV